MTYFLKDIATYLYHKLGGDFRDTIVVFPNRRARLFFNHFLSELTDKPIWTPQYFTISDFISQLSNTKTADPLTLLFKLFKIFKSVTGSNESFDTFYYYCEMLLADFDDIDKYRVDASQLYLNLSDLKALEDYYEYLEENQIKTLREFWEMFNKSRNSEEKEQFKSIWEIVSVLYKKFNAELEEEALAYEGRAYRLAIDTLLSDGIPSALNKQIAFVGFNALNKSEEILFDHFRKQGRAMFFWDYSIDYVKKDFHEAGHFLRKYLKRFPSPADFKGSEIITTENQEITTISVPSNISQVKIAEYCLQRVGSESVDNPLETALILADERLLIPVVNSLPQTMEKINISMGYPITDTPAYNFISLLADLQKNKRFNNSTQQYSYYSKDVLNICQHQFLRSVYNADAYAKLRNTISDQNLVYIEGSKIVLNSLLTAELFQPVSSASEFAAYLRSQLNTVAQHIIKEEVNKQLLWEAEVLQNMHQVLTRFHELVDNSGIELQLSTCINLIHRIMAGLSVPFSGEPLDGLQLMGILETRTLDFKNIIILSMNEGVFPKSGHVPSFIPFSLREGFGLPTIQHQDAIFSYYFYRLLHRARQVILVYNTKTEGLQKGEPSRFLQQLRYESAKPPQHINLAYQVKPFSEQTIVALKDARARERLSQFTNANESKFLSPSALNTYLTCRLKFYFRYIEEFHEPDEISETIEANVFGSILHKAMKLLYLNYLDKTVNSFDIEGIKKDTELVSRAIDQAFNEEYFNRKSDESVEYKGRNILVRRVIASYIDIVLNYDAQQAPFRIISLERPYPILFCYNPEKEAVKLGGYIDRLDEKEGIIRVIDYKTGKGSLSFKNLEELFSADAGHARDAILQSLLYAHIIDREFKGKEVQPNLYFIRSMQDPTYDSRIFQKDRSHKQLVDFETLRPEFEHHLNKVLEELFDTDTPFDQTTDLQKCSFCPYAAICQR